MLFASFELSHIIGLVSLGENTLAMWLIILPLAFVLHLLLLVNLQTLTLLDAVNPFSTIEVTIRVQD